MGSKAGKVVCLHSGTIQKAASAPSFEKDVTMKSMIRSTIATAFMLLFLVSSSLADDAVGSHEKMLRGDVADNQDEDLHRMLRGAFIVTGGGVALGLGVFFGSMILCYCLSGACSDQTAQTNKS